MSTHTQRRLCAWWGRVCAHTGLASAATLQALFYERPHVFWSDLSYTHALQTHSEKCSLRAQAALPCEPQAEPHWAHWMAHTCSVPRAACLGRGMHADHLRGSQPHHGHCPQAGDVPSCLSCTVGHAGRTMHTKWHPGFSGSLSPPQSLPLCLAHTRPHSLSCNMPVCTQRHVTTLGETCNCPGTPPLPRPPSHVTEPRKSTARQGEGRSCGRSPSPPGCMTLGESIL